MSSVFAGEAARLDVSSTEDRPLTDDERALVIRLLSDPFSFPIQFKTWLVSFLESSDLLLPRSSVQGLSSLLGSGGGSGVLGLIPAGVIFPYGGAAAPNGALLCNGAAYSRQGYKRLFDAIGTAFGGGDGSSTFNVPDLRRRIPWGSGASVAIGASDGDPETSRSIWHHHFFQDTKGLNIDGVGDHSHGFNVVQASGYNMLEGQQSMRNIAQPLVSSLSTDGAGGHGHTGWVEIAGNTSGGGAQDRPAFLVVGFIINF